jgi:bifunctional non-homologous end joining protein LigD
MRLTNLDRPLYPDGFTKGDVVDYYRTIAPALLPFLRERAVTLFRAPLGVTERAWYQTNSPGVPPSGRIAHVRGFRMCVLDTEDDLVWAAQRGTIEFHPFLARVGSAHPDWLVLDLDPGDPAGMEECCAVALALRDRLADGAWVKTSGSLGLHVLEPGCGLTFAETKKRARELAAGLPNVVTAQRLDLRAGKVLVDVLQNDATRSLVAPWSLRATAWPTVSTPVTWDEVERGGPLVFDWRDAVKRASKYQPSVPDSRGWTPAG